MDEQTFPGTLDSLEGVRDYVARAAGQAGFDRGKIYNLCLAVDEIVTNIVLHGYEEAGLSGDITLRADLDADEFVIRVEDHGKPYDPNAHRMPHPDDLSLPLEDRAIGGLGIMLAMDAVDDLQYDATAAGNVHRFIVKLPHANAATSPGRQS
ncbi:MAG: ATP-binding protein [Bryobacteraceae bacterium]|nr:ATP-binding protein [Bryobacteraceae bacterium]